jgi:hypothetical protein
MPYNFKIDVDSGLAFETWDRQLDG